MSNNIKRWLLLTVGAGVLTLLLAVAFSFVFAYKAKATAARYLLVVTRLDVGTTYGVAVEQLRSEHIPLTLPSDCHHECTLLFKSDDKWLYMMHLAPPAEFVGRLDFRDEKLVYKKTAMGREMCCFAVVIESASTISRVVPGNLDSAGHPWKIDVELAASDVTQYRKKAYAFDVACIGSVRGCRTDEYLPTFNDLQQSASK